MRAQRNGHATADTYAAYLSRTLPRDAYDRVRSHLDGCASCWAAWNRYRWDAARASPLLSELAEFLGSAFRPYFDSSTALAADWDGANPQTEQEKATFFRTSTSYLYNLVIWQASGHRPDYVTNGLSLLHHNKIRTVLDYGCGIGTDMLALRHHGFTVIGCDYDSPSTRFLRWRSQHVPLVEPSELDQVIHDVEALWIIDTLDHLTDIGTSIGQALSTVRLVITESLSNDRSHGAQRFHQRRPTAEIAQLFASHGLPLCHQSNDETITVWSRR